MKDPTITKREFGKQKEDQIPGEVQTEGKSKKRRLNASRFLSAFYLISSFITLILAGHSYVSMLATFISFMQFYELISLKRKKEEENIYIIILAWYFYAVGLFYSLLQQIKHHQFITVCLWCLGFVLEIFALERKHVTYQIRIFFQAHIIIIFQTLPTLLNISVAYEGYIWLLVTQSMVIGNDGFAYLAGTFMGETKLTDLSPNKTVEGFIGGFFGQLLCGIFFSYIFSVSNYFLCPQTNFTIVPFQLEYECLLDPIYSQKFSSAFLPFQYTMFDFHMGVLTIFIGFIAPLGGIFASGFKRAIGIKDFASIIRGHGGFTDRFDCASFMGFFAYFYLYTFVFKSRARYF